MVEVRGTLATNRESRKSSSNGSINEDHLFDWVFRHELEVILIAENVKFAKQIGVV